MPRLKKHRKGPLSDAEMDNLKPRGQKQSWHQFAASVRKLSHQQGMGIDLLHTVIATESFFHMQWHAGAKPAEALKRFRGRRKVKEMEGAAS